MKKVVFFLYYCTEYLHSNALEIDVIQGCFVVVFLHENAFEMNWFKKMSFLEDVFF